jgi:hypothetical protein
MYESISIKETKESKWYDRLRKYERAHLSKKYPITETETVDKWIVRVYNKIKK